MRLARPCSLSASLLSEACDDPAKEGHTDAVKRGAAADDDSHAVLSEQAACRRQADGGRQRVADPADEVKLNNTKRASASEKGQALFLRSEPGKRRSKIFLRNFQIPCRFLALNVAVRGWREKSS